VASIFKPLKLLYLYLTFWEYRLDLEIPSHRFDIAAQCGDIHIRALFHLGYCTLVDVEDFRQINLREAPRLSKLMKGHYWDSFFYTLANPRFTLW